MHAAQRDYSVDTVRRSVLEPSQHLLGRPSRRASRRGSDRGQFSLLLVRGDGARVVRVTIPRRLPALLLLAAAAAAAIGGALVSDWWQLRHRLLDSAGLIQQIQRQQATIDSFTQRIGALRREVGTWRDLHTRIWEAFGPENPARGRVKGMGGGTAPADGATAAATSPGDELDLLTASVRAEGESLRDLDKLVERARRALAALPSRWPIRGAVNSEFGTRMSPWSREPEFHGGLDIAADRGTPVRAPSAGTVVHAGPHGEYGLAVILDHGHDLRSIYGHLSKVGVRPGQQVERGAEIAHSGNTGRSSGPHLHYEIVVKGQSVNPRTFLWD